MPLFGSLLHTEIATPKVQYSSKAFRVHNYKQKMKKGVASFPHDDWPKHVRVGIILEKRESVNKKQICSTTPTPDDSKFSTMRQPINDGNSPRDPQNR